MDDNIHVLRFLSLSGTSSSRTLLTVIEGLTEALRNGLQMPKVAVSTALIPERIRRYVLNPDGSVIRDRYEFLVYRQLRDRLEAGDLFCPDSARYRSFEDDLVDEATLENKATLLPQLGLAQTTSSIKEQLAVLKDALNTRLEAVNERICAGENRFVQLRRGQIVWSRGHDAQEPHQEGAMGVRQYRQEPLPARLCRLARPTPQCPQGAEPR